MAWNLFKLQKLKIRAFPNRERQWFPPLRPPAEWTAMFNPSSLKRSYGISYGRRSRIINSSAKQAQYSYSDPSGLELELLLDGTGVHQMGLFGFRTKTVEQRIEDLKKIAYAYDGEIHEPPFLTVEWGNLRFDCRLKSLNVSYDLFDRDGTPLRAKLALSFVADVADQKRNRKEKKSSPDLTHSRTVRHGDTLPLLTREIYGSPAHYLAVARFNELDDFRHLTPGRQIRFPPLEQLPRTAGAPDPWQGAR